MTTTWTLSGNTANLKSFAAQQQDLFAYYLVGRTGTFLDLGCWRPRHNNNTYMLESLGWNGLLFDRDHEAIQMCNKIRQSPSFCIDVESDDFVKVLKLHWKSSHFNYISLDVDEASLKVLSSLLENNYTFSCMTFEHDFYQLGNDLKEPSQKILTKYGYECLFDNVIAFPTHAPCQMKKYPDGIKFEDWWVNPKHFKAELMTKKESSMHHGDCVDKIKGATWKT